MAGVVVTLFATAVQRGLLQTNDYSRTVLLYNHGDSDLLEDMERVILVQVTAMQDLVSRNLESLIRCN